MDFLELLRSKEKLPNFLEKPVEYSKLGKIVQSAILAPSELQAYKIYVIGSEKAKENVMVACDYQEFITKTPVLILFCADIKKAETKYGERSELIAIRDALNAANYAHLCAINEGIASVFINDYHPLEILRSVDAKEYEIPVALLALGYSETEAEDKPKRMMKELVFEV